MPEKVIDVQHTVYHVRIKRTIIMTVDDQRNVSAQTKLVDEPVELGIAAVENIASDRDALDARQLADQIFNALN